MTDPLTHTIPPTQKWNFPHCVRFLHCLIFISLLVRIRNGGGTMCGMEILGIERLFPKDEMKKDFNKYNDEREKRIQ